MATQRVYPVYIEGHEDRYRGHITMKRWTMPRYNEWRKAVASDPTQLKELGYDAFVRAQWVALWGTIQMVEEWAVEELNEDGEWEAVPIPPIGEIPLDENGEEIGIDFYLFMWIAAVSNDYIVPAVTHDPKLSPSESSPS